MDRTLGCYIQIPVQLQQLGVLRRQDAKKVMQLQGQLFEMTLRQEKVPSLVGTKGISNLSGFSSRVKASGAWGRSSLTIS
eukprot:5563553-Amphidinium_carterae.1